MVRSPLSLKVASFKPMRPNKSLDEAQQIAECGSVRERATRAVLYVPNDALQDGY